MESLTALILKTIIWIAFPICGLIGWIYYIKLRHEERKLWIEQGVNPDSHTNKKNNWALLWPKLGVVILSLGLGLLIITVLINFKVAGHSDAVFPAILCVCGGLGLVIAHYLEIRKRAE